MEIYNSNNRYKDLFFALSHGVNFGKLKSRNIDEREAFLNELITKNKKFTSCPAFATSIVDKVGAGDAMLSLFSTALYKSQSPELALFIGSLAAANSLKRFGNDKIVSQTDLIRSAEYIFK